MTGQNVRDVIVEEVPFCGCTNEELEHGQGCPNRVADPRFPGGTVGGPGGPPAFNAENVAAVEATLSPEANTEVSFDEVVRLLTEKGVAAYVEQTGGGCATIYASRQWGPEEPLLRMGKQEGTHAYPEKHRHSNGDDYYEIGVGPGWFAGPGWSDGRGDTVDLYVGPDGDEDAPGEDVPVGASAADVAEMVARQLASFQPPVVNV
jgi:hypothetical protein